MNRAFKVAALLAAALGVLGVALRILRGPRTPEQDDAEVTSADDFAIGAAPTAVPDANRVGTTGAQRAPVRQDGNSPANVIGAAAPAATAEADPADDPLDPRRGSQGLRVLPPNQTSPCASAPSESFATSTAPASSSRWATVAASSMIRSLN